MSLSQGHCHLEFKGIKQLTHFKQLLYYLFLEIRVRIRFTFKQHTSFSKTIKTSCSLIIRVLWKVKIQIYDNFFYKKCVCLSKCWKSISLKVLSENETQCVLSKQPVLAVKCVVMSTKNKTCMVSHMASPTVKYDLTKQTTVVSYSNENGLFCLFLSTKTDGQ